MSRRSFSRWASWTLSAALICHFGVQSASAQSLFGGGGSTSQSGRSSLGGSGFGGSSGGLVRSTTPASGFTSGFGGSNRIGQTGGVGGALNTAGTAGQAGLTGPQLNMSLGQLSATIGQGGFVGRSDTAGRFVGNVMAGQQSIQSTNVGGQFGGGQFGRGQSGGGRNGFNQQGGFGQQNRRAIRPQLRLAFEYEAPPTTEIQTNLNTQFQRLQTDRPELQGVQIQLGANREVVLRGQVATENDKKLAAMLARMEPGVRTVKNELTVQGE